MTIAVETWPLEDHRCRACDAMVDEQYRIVHVETGKYLKIKACFQHKDSEIDKATRALLAEVEKKQ